MSRPTVGELEIQLKNLVRNWESFARQLPGLEDSALEKIKYNKKHDDIDSQKAALYSKWLEVCPNASWDDVVAALHKAEENTIAKHVQEWLSIIDRQMSLSPKQPQAIEVSEVSPSGTDVNTSIQQDYEVPESIVEELEDLHETFVPLATEINSELQDAADDSKVSVKSLASYVQLQFIGPSHFSRVPPTSSANNAEQILQSVQQHYTFLNPNFILNMATFFLVSYPITKQAEAYKTRIATFKKNVKVRSLKNELGQFNKHLRKSSNNLILKILVTNAWGEQSIQLVQMLLLTLFPIVDPDELPWYSVCAGSFLLSFIANNHMILPLIVSCARKMEFMRHLGIISVTIGNILIRVNNEETEDDDLFSFEDSLIQATASDHIEAVRFLLKYIHINVNAIFATKKNYFQKSHNKQTQILMEDETLTFLGNHIYQLKIIKEEIAQHITSNLEVNPLASSDEPNIAKFLQEIEYHVLNTILLRNQLSHLPDSFQQKLAHMCKYVEITKSLAKIAHLQKFLQFFPPLNYTTQVTIILSKVWSECSITENEIIIKFLFPDTSIDEFYWFRVKGLKKTLKLKLLITPPKDGRFVFHHPLAKAIGVIQVRLNNDTIFMSEENKDGYTFEKGIREAKGLDKTHQFLLVSFLQHVMEFSCQLFPGDTIEPDRNNNFQMVPDHDSTPLMIACCNSNGQLVQLLLEHGADPNVKTSTVTFKTALFYCINSSKIFQMLLNHGADIAAVKASDETLLQNACITNSVKVVDIIMLSNKYPHINTKDSIGNTALWRACSRGYTDIVERLLKAKADPSIPNSLGLTPLATASFEGRLPIIEKFIKAKINLNTVGADGRTPLFFASSRGHEAVVECLLCAQADPNIPDNEGITPLWATSSAGHEAIVQHLLNAQADPNIPNNDGITPLQIAYERRYVRIVSMLFNHILANYDSHNEDRRLAWIDKAKGQLSVEAVQFLLQAQTDPSILENMDQQSLSIYRQQANIKSSFGNMYMFLDSNIMLKLH